MVSGELGQVLIDVKYDGYADNQYDGVDVGTDKLINDVPVHSLDIAEGIQLLHPGQSVPRQPAQPLGQRPQQYQQAQPETAHLIPYLLQSLFHLLRPKLSITDRFHCTKSPCSICVRASVTKRR